MDVSYDLTCEIDNYVSQERLTDKEHRIRNETKLVRGRRSLFILTFLASINDRPLHV